jgi:hypothetical protein
MIFIPRARIYVKGIDASAKADFCSLMKGHGIAVTQAEGRVPADVDTAITVTTSKTAVYVEEARADRHCWSRFRYSRRGRNFASNNPRQPAVRRRPEWNAR